MTKEIILTQRRIALVDDEDFEMLSIWKWCTISIKNTDKHYAQRRLNNNKHISMHRQILGITSSKIYVDHINHNGLDNQRFNLRIVTKQQNNQYRRKQEKCNGIKCTSLFKGVNYYKSRFQYRAYIKTEKQFINLGYFLSEEEAARAYDDAAHHLFGEFAVLNFPERWANNSKE